MKQICCLLLLLTSISSTVLLQSCKDAFAPACADTKVTHQHISADDLTKVPYTGFDTLYFLNKQGDTCIVRGTGKQYGTEVDTRSIDPACPPEEKYINQFYTINFVTLKGNLEFKLFQKRSDYNIIIDRAIYNAVFRYRSGMIDFENLKDPYYIDSLTINGKLYNRINIFLTGVKGTTAMRDTSYKLLYNKPYGVLYIKSTKENEEFSIIPKP